MRSAEIIDAAIQADIGDWLTDAVGEAEHGASSLILDAFIPRELTRLEAVVAPTAPTVEATELDRLLHEAVCRLS